MILLNVTSFNIRISRQFIATIHRRLLIPKGSENSGNPTQHDQNIQVKD